MTRTTWSLIALAVAGPVLAGDNGSDSLCYEVVGCVQNRNISVSDAEKLGCDQLWQRHLRRARILLPRRPRQGRVRQ
jgi:hypothetical protein